MVDGQQRLTTLSILLCAIRDHRAKQRTPSTATGINQQYLINKWKPEQHRLKLATHPGRPGRLPRLPGLDAAGRRE